jgi:ATP synthase protein I
MLPEASMSQENGGSDPSFEARLTAARSKQGLDAPPKQSPGDQGGLGVSAWGIGMRVGIELVSALVVAVAIGYGLDRIFHTTPILTAVFVPLGGAAGVLNLWREFAPKRSGSGRG